jgi:polyphosphate kinase
MANQTLLDRELSWVEFNRRVLDQAHREETPLLERVRFLTIVSSNFDEFFMVRVAALKRERGAAARTRQRLEQVAAAAHEVVAGQYRALHTRIVPQLASAGMHLVAGADLTADQRRAADDDFRYQIYPALSSVRLPDDGPLAVANLRLHLAFRLQPAAADGVPGQTEKTAAPLTADGGGRSGGGEAIALVAIPSGLERLRPIPSRSRNEASFLLAEDSIVLHAEQLFPGYRITDHALFRVTRDADLEVDEATDEDFIEAMAAVLVERRSSGVVRLEIDASGDALAELLVGRLGLGAQDVYRVAPIDLTGLKTLPDSGHGDLCFPAWRPLPAPALADADPWQVLQRRDVLLHHPFETFDHVLGLLQAAAGDDAVLAIKMTLYRTSGDSPVVQALERAAANGKQVTALVEIKARFDEQQNIDWAARLERAGAIVVYGIAGLKVHAKAMLIVRREAGGVRTYTHLGTGNYNDTTARLYTDLGLLTARDAIGHEATLFFNAITGYSSAPRLQRLTMAPTALKRTLIAHIQREAAAADSGGLIMAKMNSLSDPDVIAALYAAAQAGVTVLLNVRGVCLLRPQVPGLSDNIRVVSIVGRFLEHSRITYFRNGGNEQVYLASADWMPRNLERRVELMFPVEQPDLRRRLVRILELYFADNCHSYELQPDGRYRKRRPPPPESGKRRAEIHSQERLQQQAWTAERRRVRPDEREFTVRRRPPG